MAEVVLSAEARLRDELAHFYADPYGFVLFAYPWPIKGEDGPDRWQREVLDDLGRQVATRGFDGVTPVLPIREAISSGHGIGKSALFAWVVDWLMSTRRDARGTLTANTNYQLETKTWAAVQEWTARCITAHWFEINSAIMYRKGCRATWFCSPQSCAEQNSEAFAGQHAKNSSSFYIFDEASAVADQIWEVAEGGLTDGEPFILVGGQPTRSQGAFHEAVFGVRRERWQARIIDSRTCKLRNDALIQQWHEDYGEDSDFFRVRVRGLPPAASDLQYIDTRTVKAAQDRQSSAFADDPLVCGLDVARGGGDTCVFRFRRGIDARSIPPIRVPGEHMRDSMQLVMMATNVLSKTYEGRSVTMLFIDGTGIGGPIVDRLKQLGHRNVMDIQFGAKAPDPKFANLRAFMWGQLRDWLTRGVIDADPRLEQDLTGPSYSHDKQDRLLLESKEHMKARNVASPDDADALALTFALPVGLARPPRYQTPSRGEMGWAG